MKRRVFPDSQSVSPVHDGVGHIRPEGVSWIENNVSLLVCCDVRFGGGLGCRGCRTGDCGSGVSSRSVFGGEWSDSFHRVGDQSWTSVRLRILATRIRSGRRSRRCCPVAVGCARCASVQRVAVRTVLLRGRRTASTWRLSQQTRGRRWRSSSRTAPGYDTSRSASLGVTPLPAAASDASIAWSPNGRRRRLRRWGASDVDSPAVHGRPRRKRAAAKSQTCAPTNPPGSVGGTITFGGPAKSRLRASTRSDPTARGSTKWSTIAIGRRAYPDWSPNGTELAYTGAVSDGQTNIYICDASGKRAHRLTQHGGSQPVWSPDGKYIAFVNNNGLYVVQRNGHGLAAHCQRATDIGKGPRRGSF